DRRILAVATHRSSAYASRVPFAARPTAPRAFFEKLQAAFPPNRPLASASAAATGPVAATVSLSPPQGPSLQRSVRAVAAYFATNARIHTQNGDHSHRSFPASLPLHRLPQDDSRAGHFRRPRHTSAACAAQDPAGRSRSPAPSAPSPLPSCLPA